MSYREIPFSKLLQDRAIFTVFDEEFQKGRWLDIAALVSSESCVDEAYKDGTIPSDTLDEITSRLDDILK